MPAPVTWLLAAVILLGPPLSIVGLLVWARRLRKRGAPPSGVRVAYVLAAIVGLVTVTGYVGAVMAVKHSIGDEAVDPSQKARALAEGISEAMNCEALALLIAVIGGAGFGLWRWRRLKGGSRVAPSRN